MSGVGASRRLIGRDAALAMTGAALAEASAGAGGLMLVTGEPGIGKSAVLAEQARDAAAAGVRVLRGGGWQGADTPPYWLWTQVLRGLAPDELGDAARLLDVAITPDHDAAGAPEARFRLFDAVSRALARLAVASPVLVVLDDLQWSDNPALRLLGFLHGAMAAERVLFLGAYRDGEVATALREVVGDAPVVPLAGLDVEGVTALMAAVAGPVPNSVLADTVRRRSGGNPFFVRELTRLLIARGDWHCGEQAMSELGVPDAVDQTLRMRLARLSRPCTDLLELAAIAGSDVAPLELAEAAPSSERHLGELLDEAGAARVLVNTANGWRFAHDLYRETLLARIPAGRRARLHAAVGHALHVLSAGGTDPAAVGGAARLAAHFVAAGPASVDQALRYCVLAAREATARLGHDDAARHYTTALRLSADEAGRVELLGELAAACDRAGNPDASREAYLRAVELARRASGPVALAEVALGVAALGARSGTDDPVAVSLLGEAAELLAGAGDTDGDGAGPGPGPHGALRSRVLAALARALRHSALGTISPRAIQAAREAVELADTHADAAALAHGLLAQHDVMWAPGEAAARLAVLARMSAAAERAGDRDLIAEAVLLRAAALIEQGDPQGPVELARYTGLADQLGHARGRWSALHRRATLAELTGRIEDAVTLADQALELGTAIGLPDALGCFATLRGSLATIGGPSEPLTELMPSVDPLWPVYPLLRAWCQIHAGDLDGARTCLSGFSVQAVPHQYDLELAAIAATVFAAVGTSQQREWAYRRLAPYAGLHAVVGGCAAYHGAVDHYLGALAEALSRNEDATAHFAAAIERCERLGASAWAERSRGALRRLHPEPGPDGGDTFRPVNGLWQLRFNGREAHLPEAKGLRDIATLLATPQRPIHVFTLLGREAPALGADPVLDRHAVAEYRARLAELASEIDQADDWNDTHRAERARTERDALIAQLHTATGLGGRARRLGDETERARKTVTARIRDTIRHVERVHPTLANHLQAALHTGTTCIYTPDTPRQWRL